MIRDDPIESTASVSIRYWPITLDRISEGRKKYDPTHAVCHMIATVSRQSGAFSWELPHGSYLLNNHVSSVAVFQS
jgi:hypothetical protein